MQNFACKELLTEIDRDLVLVPMEIIYPRKEKHMDLMDTTLPAGDNIIMSYINSLLQTASLFYNNSQKSWVDTFNFLISIPYELNHGISYIIAREICMLAIFS